MTSKKIEEIVMLSLGKNVSRIEDKETVYGTEDFENDLYDNENYNCGRSNTCRLVYVDRLRTC